MKKIIINGRYLLHRVTGVERYAGELICALDEVLSACRQDGITSAGGLPETPSADGLTEMPSDCGLSEIPSDGMLVKTPSAVKRGAVRSSVQFELAVPPEVEGQAIPVLRNITVRRVGRLHNRVWEHVSFPAYVKRQGGIALNLCNVAPIPAPGIVTVHDMKPIAHPEYYSRKFVLWYKLLFANELRRSYMVLTGTKFSAKEIIRYYHVDPRKIHLIPEGWEHFGRIDYDRFALERYGLEKGAYFFSMGSREAGKNLKWIIESARRHPEMVYAISGNVNRNVFSDDSPSPERRDQDSAPDNVPDNTPDYAPDRVPDNVRFLGYVTDEEAKTLMRDCKAFLFPTFYEGFGMPPLEAISAGCPCVVVSDIPVMHEIFEGEAVYIDPDVVEDFECRPADAAKILEKYSWKKSAGKLLRILETIPDRHWV